MTQRFIPGLLIATAVLVAGLIVAFAIGRYPVGLGDLFNVLWSSATASSSSTASLGATPRPTGWHEGKNDHFGFFETLKRFMPELKSHDYADFPSGRVMPYNTLSSVIGSSRMRFPGRVEKRVGEGRRRTGDADFADAVRRVLIGDVVIDDLDVGTSK